MMKWLLLAGTGGFMFASWFGCQGGSTLLQGVIELVDIAAGALTGAAVTGLLT